MRIVAQVVDQVSPADVQHRADRDERTESDVHAQAPVEDGSTQCAALAQEADCSWPGVLGCECRVQAPMWAHHAQAVGPDQSHPALPGLLEHLALELGPLRTDLLEPRRDDDGPFDPGLDTVADHLGHRRRGRDDHGQVNRLGHGRDFRV